MPPTIKEDANSPVSIEIGNVQDTNYELIIHWTNDTETLTRKFVSQKTPEEQITYDTDGYICSNNDKRIFIVSRFWENGLWFLNEFPFSDAPKFLVDTEVAKAMFPRLGIHNLSDYIQRLETKYVPRLH